MCYGLIDYLVFYGTSDWSICEILPGEVLDLAVEDNKRGIDNFMVLLLVQMLAFFL